jgi:tRNA pseudouridine55 synthase
MEGIGAFYKPESISSFGFLKILKKYFKEKKIGHGGTLDPFAKGVLVVGIQRKYTKMLSQILKNSEKEYLAKICLGKISSTDDPEGKLQDFKFSKIPQKNEIEDILKNFEGEILQKPPKFSAIKIDGKRSYELAREGKDFNLEERKVFIKKIELINYSFPELVIKVICGSGVYLRSLARDIGISLGTGAYLKELERERVGDFKKDFALTKEDLEKDFLELEILLSGMVQGVGFRAFSNFWAEKNNLVGYVQNLLDGKLKIVCQGRLEDLNNFLEKIKTGPPLAKVEDLQVKILKPTTIFPDFKIKYFFKFI